MSRKTLCPICDNRPVAPEFSPFCSKRCADVDLSRWLSDAYTIPGAPAEDADDSPDAGAPRPRDDD